MKRKFILVRKFITAFLAFLIIGINLPVSAQTKPFEERAAIFEKVWNTINEKYYDASFNGVDWAAVGKKYRLRLGKVSSEKEFYALLDQMAGELRDSHTRVYSPLQREERSKQKRTSTGINLKEIEGNTIIYSVAPDSEAFRLGIRTGMRVHSINGQSIKKARSEAVRAVGVSSSERAAKMRVLSRLTAGEPGTILNIVLRGKNGKRQNYALKRQLVSTAPQVSSEVLPSGIAYLKFNNFDESIEDEIRETLQKFKDAPALIVDLRGNGGGDGDVGLRFAGHFFAEKITVAKILTRTGKPPLPGIPMILETGAPETQIYSNPLVILIDERTASSAELIANALQEKGRAKIFGTSFSCGCVLAFLGFIELAGGGDFTLSEFGFITAESRTLEGRGVAPDKIVPLTLKDAESNRDAALDEAINYLKTNQ